MRSLQARLVTGLLPGLIISFTGLWLLITINVEYLAEQYIASRLEHDAETLLNALHFDNQGNLTIDHNRIDLVYNRPFSGHYYVISSSARRFNSRSLWDQTLEHGVLETGERQRTIQPGPEQQSLLVLTRGYGKQGNQLTLSIAEDLDPIKENIRQLQYWLALMALAVLILLVFLQMLILRRSLQPLLKIHGELKLLEQGQLDKLGTDSPSELRPLINEVNHLLSVVEQRMRRSRDAASNLAHAIKQPLTVIQQIIDKSALSHNQQQMLLQQTQDIYQLTDRILKRARLAGPGHGSALFVFADDMPALIKTLDMMYADKSLKVSGIIPDTISCPVDREDMLELLGNVLDNAYKWAAGEIIISVNVDSALHICIEDDGPGADIEKLNELSKRGVRLDENIQGHGFGLAIAADIVADYHGSISFEQSSKLGGFLSRISLPLQLR